MDIGRATSFLEQELAKVRSEMEVVSDEFLDRYDDGSGKLAVKFLYHEEAKRGASTEDIMAVLKKRDVTAIAKVDREEFVKLASRVQRRAAKSSGAPPSTPTEPEAVLAAHERMDAITAHPMWTHQEMPARISARMYLGSADHSANVETLLRLGIGAVLNCAPSDCTDPTEAYRAAGITYSECDAEDFEGYPLLELHLHEALTFTRAQGTDGVILVHCQAGVNRSAAIAIAMLMEQDRQPLLPLVEHCYERRPFILRNRSFRRSLVARAAAQGLLHDTSIPCRPQLMDVRVLKAP